jgi:hypothetical protein
VLFHNKKGALEKKKSKVVKRKKDAKKENFFDFYKRKRESARAEVNSEKTEI